MKKGKESGPNTSDRRLQSQMDQGNKPENKADRKTIQKQQQSSGVKRKNSAHETDRNSKKIRGNNAPPRKWQTAKQPKKWMHRQNWYSRETDKKRKRKTKRNSTLRNWTHQKMMKIKEQLHGNTLWGDIGLVEYNQETRTWGCRIGDCETKIETAKRISP